MPRKLSLPVNDRYTSCPKCGNNQRFTARSMQVMEDLCEVWVICTCGFDPTSHKAMGSGYRFEDVWGGTGDVNCYMALRCWNDAVEAFDKKTNQIPA